MTATRKKQCDDAKKETQRYYELPIQKQELKCENHPHCWFQQQNHN